MGNVGMQLKKTTADSPVSHVKTDLLVDEQSNSHIHELHPQSQELVRLCHTLPLEVVQLGNYLCILIHYTIFLVFPHEEK